MITAIIPARGGSKGVPRKNVRTLYGYPLIAWSIVQARLSAAIDEVIVSTDDDEIADVSAACGATVVRRSKATATDDATTESVLHELLDVLVPHPTWIVLLQPTSPFRQEDDIHNCVQVAVGHNSSFSARVIDGYTWTEVNRTALAPDYTYRYKRQDRLERRIEENGSIYVFRPRMIETFGKRLAGSIQYSEMHPLDSFQVDTEDDLEMLETLAPLRLGWLTPYMSTSTEFCATTQTGNTIEPSHIEKTY